MTDNDLTELNRRVAKARGWAIMPDPSTSRDDMYEVISPDGSLYAWTGTPETIWRDLFGAVCEISIPDWAGDANAALGLLREMNEAGDWNSGSWGLSYCKSNEQYIVKWIAPFGFEDATEAPTAAEAIVRAWLAWHEAQEAGEGEG